MLGSRKVNDKKDSINGKRQRAWRKLVYGRERRITTLRVRVSHAGRMRSQSVNKEGSKSNRAGNEDWGRRVKRSKTERL